MELEG